MGQRGLTPPPPYDSLQETMVPLRLTMSVCRTMQQQHELYKEYTALKYTIYNARCQYHSLDLRPNYGQELRTQELARLVDEIQRYKTEMAALEEKLEKCQEEVETTNAEIMAYVRANE